MKILQLIKELFASEDIFKTFKEKTIRYRMMKIYYSLHPLLKSFARIPLYLYLPFYLIPYIMFSYSISGAFKSFIDILFLFASLWIGDFFLTLILFILRSSKTVRKLEKTVNWKNYPEASIIFSGLYIFILLYYFREFLIARDIDIMSYLPHSLNPYTIPSLIVVFSIIILWIFYG